MGDREVGGLSILFTRAGQRRTASCSTLGASSVLQKRGITCQPGLHPERIVLQVGGKVSDNNNVIVIVIEIVSVGLEVGLANPAFSLKDKPLCLIVLLQSLSRPSGYKVGNSTGPTDCSYVLC